jgi:hypothetical protein
MARPRRKDEELKAVLEHFYYEIDMLKGTIERLNDQSTLDRILSTSTVLPH